MQDRKKRASFVERMLAIQEGGYHSSAPEPVSSTEDVIYEENALTQEELEYVMENISVEQLDELTGKGQLGSIKKKLNDKRAALHAANPGKEKNFFGALKNSRPDQRIQNAKWRAGALDNVRGAQENRKYAHLAGHSDRLISKGMAKSQEYRSKYRYKRPGLNKEELEFVEENISFEQLDEISQALAGSYKNKANRQVGDILSGIEIAHRLGTDDAKAWNKQAYRRLSNRRNGLLRADKKKK